jgi:hypothetical protein
MKRSRSPLSENTLERLAQGEYVSDEFVSDVSDIESSSTEVDDTDSDPDYDPNIELGLPSTSGRLVNNLLNVPDTESDDENYVTQTQTLPPRRPRGRPRQTTASLNSESSSSESESGWQDVIEDQDTGYNHNFSFHELPGIKHCPPRDSPPISYFRLFFTTTLLEMFVKYTNRYAERFIKDNVERLKEHSRTKVWKPVTLLEMQGFLAVLLNMGLNKKPTIYSYWWTNSSQYIPWFGKMFTRNQFQAILQFFHMVDTHELPTPGQPNYDPCARFNPLVEHMNRLANHHYTPEKQLSIDESMVGTKTHSQLLQYMPKKHHRFGIKLWMLCDAVTHYCMNFFVYRGAKGPEKQQIKEKGLAYTVVVRLLEYGNFLNKGYHIFVDNFFTTMKLARYLYSKCTFITGTLRKNRKGISPDMKKSLMLG